MGRVYLLTALAVTPSGSRAMTQMEVGVTYNSFTFGIGGALTLIGPNPTFGTPHSQQFPDDRDRLPHLRPRAYRLQHYGRACKGRHRY